MKKYISPCFLFVGVLTLAASLFIGYYFVPHKIRENVIQNSKIELGNTRYKNWQKLPVPLFQKIYLFNVTNPYEVIQGGKPVLQEVGPYVYQQKREKFDIVFNSENGTIFYRERMDYYFRPELSNGLESDPITVVNIPYVSTVMKATKLDVFSRSIVADILKGFPDLQLYVNVTVGELLFGGYYLPFMKELSELKGEQLLPNNTFGLYYGKNGSDAGLFEIYSGSQHPDKFGDVVTWNGMSQLDWYDNPYCNRMNGSDGANFQPFATKERTFNMFIPGLCKSFRFTFDSDGIEVKGLPVLKYAIGPSFLESGKTNPDNRCYCGDPDDLESCAENGVFPLAKCGKGAMALSQPHFYQGSELYLNQSVGLNPNKERHEMALYIESYTAASAKINLRFQMNVDLKPTKFFKPLKKVPRMVHPVFWIDQSVEMPDEPLNILKNKLYGTVKTASLLTHVGIIVGSALILASLLCFFLCSANSSVENAQPEKVVECVSYHPQGTLPNGKILLNGNGKASSNCHNHNPNHVHNIEHVTVPLLQMQNEALPSPQAQPHSPQTSTDNQQQSDLDKQPDSHLNPFPSTTEYPSSLSITTAANRELVEAVSSYENL